MTSARRVESELHPAARGFGRVADAYERGRPGYPSDAIDWLVAKLDLAPGRTVVDLAAGTGKFTRMLVRSGAEVVAVEPIAEMRERIRDARAVEGTAEAIPLPDASADALTVAQAFHWFHADGALAEIHRVLRRGGGLALVWNVRDESSPLQAAASAIIDTLDAGAPRAGNVDWAGVIESSGLFGPVELRTFDHEQPADEEAFVQRFMTVSFVASAPANVRSEVEAELRALARNAGLPIRLPYVTRLYVAFAS